jgi:hypothetical protein
MDDKTTIIDYLKELSTRNKSDVKDEQIIQAIMNKLNIDGTVTGGIVYIKPYNKEPLDIHKFAQTLLKGWGI